MKNYVPAIAAAVAGATAMYFLDPEQGRRRRALVRDRVVSASAHTSDAARARSRWAGNAIKGWAAGMASRLPGRGDSPSAAMLEQRVRSHLGRAVSHPKAVHVDVMEDRTVCLTGHILENELEFLLEQVEGVPGVARVDSQLTVHESAGNIPELQGDGRAGRAPRSNSRFWRVLAWTAPVAVLAATVRRPAPRRTRIGAVWGARRPLPGLIARAARRNGSRHALGAWR